MDGHRLKAEKWKRRVNKTVTIQTKAKCYGNFLNDYLFFYHNHTANNEQPATNTSNFSVIWTMNNVNYILLFVFIFISIAINSEPFNEPALFCCNWMDEKSFIFVIFRIYIIYVLKRAQKTNAVNWYGGYFNIENKSLLNFPEAEINDEYVTLLRTNKFSAQNKKLVTETYRET